MDGGRRNAQNEDNQQTDLLHQPLEDHDDDHDDHYDHDDHDHDDVDHNEDVCC